jgi:tungstate transport system permease protein
MGTAIALTTFPGKKIVMSLVNTGMGLPPVLAA